MSNACSCQYKMTEATTMIYFKSHTIPQVCGNLVLILAHIVSFATSCCKKLCNFAAHLNINISDHETIVFIFVHKY